ncbi:MAG: hypothetical protein ABI561_23240 [Bradyrhizobium sp.]
MSGDEGTGWSLVEFAKQVAAIPKRIADAAGDIGTTIPTSETNAPSSALEEGSLEAKVPEAKFLEGEVNQEAGIAMPAAAPTGINAKSAPTTSESERLVPSSQPSPSLPKQQKTPEEIAKMIMATLRTLDRCPDRGFVVTVYGSNPWNAMLTITPEAGPSINRTLWSSRVRDLGVQFRASFDVP